MRDKKIAVLIIFIAIAFNSCASSEYLQISVNDIPKDLNIDCYNYSRFERITTIYKEDVTVHFWFYYKYSGYENFYYVDLISFIDSKAYRKVSFIQEKLNLTPYINNEIKHIKRYYEPKNKCR